MAKCSICDSRKGKRNCVISGTLICSLCCAETRDEETCLECRHYKEPKVHDKYKDIPMFPLQQMADDLQLQDYANSIEASLCVFDHLEKRKISDRTILGILELLLDKYHFKETVFMTEDRLVGKGFAFVESVIAEDLEGVPQETIAKLLGDIYFVAKRRSQGGREHIDFLHHYAGVRVAKGMRIKEI